MAKISNAIKKKSGTLTKGCVASSNKFQYHKFDQKPHYDNLEIIKVGKNT